MIAERLGVCQTRAIKRTQEYHIFVKYLFPESGDIGVRATVNSASKAQRIIMNERQPIADWRISLWFVMLSPLLGILLGALALLVFSD